MAAAILAVTRSYACHMRIAMCSIHVTDPAHAYRFYTDVLGFDDYLTMPEHNLFIVRASGQDTGLLLEPSDNPIAETYRSQLYGAGIPCLVLGTDTLDSDVERLRKAGVRIVGEVFEDASGRAVNFDDTVGNLIQLHEAAQP